MSLIHYKFKAAKDYSTVAFDGSGIALGDLKLEVIHQSNLGRVTDYDLIVVNAQTGEAYKDDHALVPKNTSVVVSRVPAGKTGGLMAYIQQKETHAQTEPMSLGSASSKFAPMSIAPAPTMQGTEEENIQAVIDRRNHDWQSSRPSKRGGFLQNQPFRHPPPTYVCHRCGQRGHFINHCPTNEDVQFDRPQLKFASGIPKTFLKRVDASTVAGTPGVVVNEDGQLVMVQANENTWKRSAVLTSLSVATDQPAAGFESDLYAMPTSEEQTPKTQIPLQPVVAQASEMPSAEKLPSANGRGHTAASVHVPVHPISVYEDPAMPRSSYPTPSYPPALPMQSHAMHDQVRGGFHLPYPAASTPYAWRPPPYDHPPLSMHSYPSPPALFPVGHGRNDVQRRYPSRDRGYSRERSRSPVSRSHRSSRHRSRSRSRSRSRRHSGHSKSRSRSRSPRRHHRQEVHHHANGDDHASYSQRNKRATIDEERSSERHERNNIARDADAVNPKLHMRSKARDDDSSRARQDHSDSGRGSSYRTSRNEDEIHKRTYGQERRSDDLRSQIDQARHERHVS